MSATHVDTSSAATDFDQPVVMTADGPRLVAGRCVHCDARMFPRRARCGSCGVGAVERWLLPTTGTLWTFTVQGFEPKAPYVPRPGGEFEPFGVGYVEFDGQLRVEGPLTEADPERLHIGAPMRVSALEVGDRLLYAFAPSVSS